MSKRPTYDGPKTLKLFEPQCGPDFCIPVAVTDDGRTVVNLLWDNSPWRYTLDGARRHVKYTNAALKRGMHLARPNSIVRVYLK